MFEFFKNLFSKKELKYKDLNANEFKAAIKSNTLLIDVRTPEEYKAGKISGAKNINIASFDFMKTIQNLDKNNDVLVYCRSGARSARAAAMLGNLGFKSVANLAGGVIAWQNHGQKLV